MMVNLHKLGHWLPLNLILYFLLLDSWSESSINTKLDYSGCADILAQARARERLYKLF